MRCVAPTHQGPFSIPAWCPNTASRTNKEENTRALMTLITRKGQNPPDCWSNWPLPGLWFQFKVVYETLESESESEVAQSCPTLCDSWTVAHEAPPTMGFSRQDYWSGLPFPSPGDLPDPGIRPRSPALKADTLTSAPPGKP